jgi:hypothetical protein
MEAIKDNASSGPVVLAERTLFRAKERTATRLTKKTASNSTQQISRSCHHDFMSRGGCARVVLAVGTLSQSKRTHRNAAVKKKIFMI